MWTASRSVCNRYARALSTVVGEGGAAGRAEQVKGAAKEFTKNASASSSLWGKLRQGQSPSKPQSQGNNANRRTGPPKQQQQRPRQQQQQQQQPPAAGVQSNQQKPRSFAPRAFNNRGKKFPSKATGEGSAESGAPGRKSRRSDDKKKWDRVPDAIQPLLFDHEFFEQKAKAGHSVVDSKMDALDAFLAEAFMGSFKTQDHTYRLFAENEEARRAHIAQPRSMLQLQSAMLPPPVNAPLGSSAHNIASAAWNVVHKNHFYDQRQQVQLVSGIAAQMLALQQQMDANIVDSDPSLDMIFDCAFSKGLPGIERENREKMMAQGVTEVDDGANKGETDWTVDAVDDEDML